MYIFAIYIIFIVITCCIGFSKLPVLSMPFKLVLAQLATGLIAEISGLLWSHLFFIGSNNFFIFNTYIAIETFLLCRAGTLILADKNIKRAFSIFYPVYLVIWAADIWLHPANNFASWAYALEGLCVSMLFLKIFLRLVHNKTASVTSEPLFWLAFSMMLYFTCMIPYFSNLHYISEKYPGISKALSLVNHTLNVIRYSVTLYSFYLYRTDKLNVKTVHD